MPVNTTALRALFWSILAGVDKIPDQWFDKIPYYQSEEMKQAQKNKKKAKKDKYGRRIQSTEDRYRKEGRNSKGEIERRRRSQDDDESDDYSDRDKRRDSRRDSRRAHSIDRHRRSGRDRDDRSDGHYSAAEGKYAQPRPRHAAEQALHQNPRMNQHGSLPGTATAGYPVAAGAAGGAAAYNPMNPMSPLNTDVHRPASSGPTGAYVPYADIYQSPTSGGYSQDPQYNAGYSAPPRHGASVQSPQDSDGRRSHRGRDRHHDDDYSDESTSSYDDRRRRHRRRSTSRSDSRSRRSSKTDGHGHRSHGNGRH